MWDGERDSTVTGSNFRSIVPDLVVNTFENCYAELLLNVCEISISIKNVTK